MHVIRLLEHGAGLLRFVAGGVEYDMARGYDRSHLIRDAVLTVRGRVVEDKGGVLGRMGDQWTYTRTHSWQGLWHMDFFTWDFPTPDDEHPWVVVDPTSGSLEEVLDGPVTRILAAGILPPGGPDGAVQMALADCPPLLLQWLASDDPDRLGLALGAVHRAPNRLYLDSLLELARSGDAQFTAVAIEEVGRTCVPSAVEALVPFIEHPDPAVRIEAALALMCCHAPNELLQELARSSPHAETVEWLEKCLVNRTSRPRSWRRWKAIADRAEDDWMRGLPG